MQNHSKPVVDAINYIRTHLCASLTVKEVSETIFYSQSKLSELFKKEVGQSIASYIEDLVMSHAQTMLIYSDLSVGSVSERLGFCDQFYFSRRFNKRFGISPKAYTNSKKLRTK
jgi:two-component system response regulator YesN